MFGDNKDFPVKGHFLFGDKMEEIWKDVIGYESLYQISNQGSVRSVSVGEGFVNVFVGTSGYKGAVLYREGNRAIPTVHELVLEAFVEPRPKGFEAHHKNGDKLDNRPENLVWWSRSQHRKYAIEVLGHRTYLMDHPELWIAGWKGSEHPRAKLTDDLVREIRVLYSTGQYTMRVLAKRFGVVCSHISNIVNRKNWKHIP